MKKTHRTITAIGILLTLAALESAAQQTFEWPGKYEAAVVLTYDDGLDCHLDVAVPALDKYGFKGTFYATGNSPSLQNRLNDWRAIVDNGHELGNHTLFHPCDGERFDWVTPEYDLNSYSMKQIVDELYAANTLLKAIDGKDSRTYAYTCSDYKANGASFVEEISNMFVAARSGGPAPENMDEVDVHFVPSWGVSDPSADQLIKFVEEAKEKGTMAVFMFHSVGGGYLNVSAEAHEALLKYLDKNRDDLWTDSFIEVMEYVSANMK